MSDRNHPIQSVAYLLRATLVSLALATILLVTTILPAEYGLDPTGLGKRFGLIALAPSADAATQEGDAACGNPASQRQDTIALVIPPRSGLEYKFSLLKGASLDYAWATNGGNLYFDFHGEPAGDTSGYFKSYREDTGTRSQGTQSVPFEGSHGWYWRNDTHSPITVTLKTQGRYDIIGIR